MRRDPDDPSPLGSLAYRFFHAPRAALRSRNAEFLLFLALGRRVRSGPFEGLRYVGSSPNTHIADALLGTLELEIRPFVRRLLAGDHDVFVNVGAAEGYYAVGFARFGRCRSVVAFEADRFGRILTRLMARKNGVAERIAVRGLCEPAHLVEAIRDHRRPALLVDVEGAEASLLDPSVNPHLARATILVELHESSVPMAELLRPRFEESHVVEEVWSRPRTVADLPRSLGLAGRLFSCGRLVRFMDERRGRPMRWWLLSPRSLASHRCHPDSTGTP